MHGAFENMSLPKFGTLPDCPKCGAKSTYGKKVRFCILAHRNEADLQYSDEEHIDVICNDCSHVRFTLCKDQSPPSEEKPIEGLAEIPASPWQATHI